MRRFLLLALLALALPMAAFANSGVDFGNNGGMLVGTNSGFTLSNSILTSVDGLNGGGLITGNNLGSVSFTTGALMSGSLQMGGTFAGGGSFLITGNGSNGIPNGTLFSGSFSGPVTWTLVTLPNGTHNYILSGTLTGVDMNGKAVSGVTVQLTINTGKGFFNGKTRISSGDTNISGSVPEPGTLGLLGSGLVGMARLLSRKRKGA